MTVTTVTAAELADTALRIRAAGISILPINHKTKRPLNDLLPVSDKGKPVWEPYQRNTAAEDVVSAWFTSGAQSFAVIGGAVSGGLFVLDFETEPAYLAWLAAVAELADGLPVGRTGKGGYHAFGRCPDPGENQKLAWLECESDISGRRILIETRGEGGYAVVAPSLHPNGSRYRMVSGDLASIPTISQARFDALIIAARKLDQCPYTRQERARIECEAAEAHQRRALASRNGSANVIDSFNAAHEVDDLLERHGYERCGDRLVRPRGRSASVTVKDGRSCHFSSNDPLNDGKVKGGIGVHDAFDVYAYFEHDGDVSKAVKAAAALLGLNERVAPTADRTPRSTPSAPTKPRADDRQGVSSASARNGGRSSWRQPEPFRTFPTDTLPYPLAQFVREAAAAIGCDDSFVALPLLVGLATAVGTTRKVRLKFDWSEYPIVWAVIVASSGQRKSPGFYAALAPLHDMQHKLIEEHRAAMQEYKQQVAAYKQAVVDYRQSGGELPQEPQRPQLKRLIVNDTTIEALALLLEENPRGVGVVRDELSAWLASFNQYKAGKGSDASQWLELHRGGLLLVDRKTAERRTIYVPRAAACIGGTIQPGIMTRGYGKEQFESGMVARTLFAMPPARQREWSDRHVEPHTRDRLAEIYTKLTHLEFDGEGNPIDLPLTGEAQDAFIRFVNEHGAEQATLGDDRLEAAWSKLEAYAARMALIMHLVRCVTDDTSLQDPNRVDEKSIRSGITLARWFGHEARRVYANMGTTDEDRERHGLVDLVRRKGGQITPRELTRHCRRYPTTDSAEQALDELVGLKLGAWNHTSPGPSGGRPQKLFLLSADSADVTETPCDDAGAGVSSATGGAEEGSVGAEVDDYERLEREAIQGDGGTE
jgi:hypothetical protein